MLMQRLIVRCAVAAAGALTFFTIALASPANCRLEVRGQQIMSGACSADFDRDGSASFEREDAGTKVSVSIFPERKATATGLLSVYRGDNSSYDDLGTLHRDGHCWTNAFVKACVVRADAR